MSWVVGHLVVVPMFLLLAEPNQTPWVHVQSVSEWVMKALPVTEQNLSFLIMSKDAIFWKQWPQTSECHCLVPYLRPVCLSRPTRVIFPIIFISKFSMKPYILSDLEIIRDFPYFTDLWRNIENISALTTTQYNVCLMFSHMVRK